MGNITNCLDFIACITLTTFACSISVTGLNIDVSCLEIAINIGIGMEAGIAMNVWAFEIDISCLEFTVYIWICTNVSMIAWGCCISIAIASTSIAIAASLVTFNTDIASFN